LKRAIEKYGFSKTIVERVAPIAQTIERNDIRQAEHRIAALALEICDAVERKTLSAKEGDDHFLLIDLFLDEHHPEVQLSKETRDLILEGNLIHDYGKDYGADFALMRTLAEKVFHRD